MCSARPFATLDTEEYLDFQAARPTVELVDGVVRSELAVARALGRLAPRRRSRPRAAARRRAEPALATFCDDVIAVARTTECEMVVTLGALLGDVPHSRPIRCTGSATDEVLAARLGHAAVALRGPDRHRRRAARRGAAGRVRVGVDLGAGSALRRDAAESRRRRARCSTGSRDLLDLGLDLTDLEIAASAWERSVDEVVAGDADASSYVERLETRYDTADDGPGWLETDDEIAVDDDDDDTDDDDWLDEDDLPSGESLAEDFERYLREQGDE